MSRTALDIPDDKIRLFCEKWKIVEFALFGSVLREDFSPTSDMDVLVTFADNVSHRMIDLIQMEQELQQLLKRRVDLVERSAVETSENYIRRQEILGSAEVVYAA